MNRSYLVGVMATKIGGYLDVIVAAAHDARAVEVNAKAELAEYGVTQKMADELNSRPFKSKK